MQIHNEESLRFLIVDKSLAGKMVLGNINEFILDKTSHFVIYVDKDLVRRVTSAKMDEY